MLALKFGGTSVGSAERIRQVRAIVARARAAEPVVVVVSACGGVTDLLVELAEAAQRGEVSLERLARRHAEVLAGLDLPPDLVDAELAEARTLLTGVSLLKELTPRSRDHILSFGERMSAKIVAAHMQREGLPARALMAWEAGLVTDARFGEARPVPQAPLRIEEALRPLLAMGQLPIITGYIAKTAAGEVTTLGRGGSDYSGALFGAALGAREIQIWTDVDGVLTTDPRLVPGARIIERVSYAEAAELAFFGAKVLHPETIKPAVERSIPIRVLNTGNPDGRGTLVAGQSDQSAEVVKAIALRRGVRVLHVQSSRMLGAHGFIRRLGEAFDRHGVAIDMMATSEVSVSLTVAREAAIEPVLEELRGFAEVAVLDGSAIVCVVGEGLRETPGVAARVFRALGDASVNVLMISQGASRLNLGLVVEAKDAEAAVRTLHAIFFER